MTTRRNFLKKITATSAILPLVSSFNELNAYPKADRQLRVAFCGLGSYARRVADAMKDCPNCVVSGAISGTPAKLEEWSKKYNFPKTNCYSYETFDDLKNNPDIDVVYVTSTNALHHPHTLKAAKAGKHVICEKPMSVTVKEAEEMIAACKAANVKLFIGYRLHFEPFTRELIRMRTSGELGKILFVNATMGFKIGDPTQWRLEKVHAGGGAMMDVGIYAINGARYATGEDPIWVIAQEQKTDLVKFKEVDETITWQMGFPSGIVANCATTYNFNNFDRLYVGGEKDSFELSPAFGYGPLKARTNKGEVNQPVVTHQTVQMTGMADCILNNTPHPNCDGEEGLKDMKIIEAIYKSIAKNGKKVMIKY
ncbi:MAG: Gfo/Idh/MocA family oxidoreductase [Thermoflexibacter sp.]|nr:Gfo/Idh/MocA family oxidoreductase [Thermoflexibacter sp.]